MGKLDNILIAQEDSEQIKQLITSNFPLPSIRPRQLEIIAFAVKSIIAGKKNIIIEAPTGVGKSAVAICISNIFNTIVDARTTIITKTKGLQDQYIKDFSYISDIRSKYDYECSHNRDLTTRIVYNSQECKMITGKFGGQKRCNPKSDCTYYKKRREWQYDAKTRLTNFNFFINAGPLILDNVVEGKSSRSEITIVDEAHNIPKQIIEASAITFEESEIADLFALLDPYPSLVDFNAIATLKSAIKTVIKEISMESEEEDLIYIHSYKKVFYQLEQSAQFLILGIEGAIAKIERKKNLTSADANKLDVLAKIKQFIDHFVLFNKVIEDSAKDTQYIISKLDSNNMNLYPLFAKYTSKHFLRSKGDVTIYISATICGGEAFAEEMGIDKDDYAFISVPSPFPINNRGFYYNPIESFSKSNRDAVLPMFAKEIDTIVDFMTETFGKEVRGVVHTASFNNADALMHLSANKQRMEVPRDANAVTKTFDLSKEENRNKILLSPSMEEGYDLKDELAQFQIIVKTPFGYLGDVIVSKRKMKSPQSYIQDTIIRIVQAHGRGVRHMEDKCYTFMIDRNFDILLNSGNYELFPEWFKEGLTVLESEPS
jgi:ATP-dependent DNA helicase DinG